MHDGVSYDMSLFVLESIKLVISTIQNLQKAGHSSVVMSKKTIPFDFVLEQLSTIDVVTRPMFGCYAIYAGNKIVLLLRQRKDFAKDNGVWLATSLEHHESLKSDFPSMRSISLFGDTPSGWQNLPAEADNFEELAIKACQLIIKGDSRIGKIPKARSSAIRKKLKTKK